MKKVKRIGSVVKVRKEKLAYYKELHRNPWPEVNAMIKACNIQNFSIYWKGDYLFSYLEYVGDDFEADMKKMAADPVTQKWWKETDPCQIPVEDHAPHEKNWSEMEEVYHLD